MENTPETREDALQRFAVQRAVMPLRGGQRIGRARRRVAARLRERGLPIEPEHIVVNRGRYSRFNDEIAWSAQVPYEPIVLQVFSWETLTALARAQQIEVRIADEAGANVWEVFSA